jgi:hypothetical protein
MARQEFRSTLRRTSDASVGATRRACAPISAPQSRNRLADPNDRGMLDAVGFDTSVPAVISDFVRAA